MDSLGSVIVTPAWTTIYYIEVLEVVEDFMLGFLGFSLRVEYLGCCCSVAKRPNI